MYITGHKVYNGQHQNMSWHHPSFLRKRWIGWRADTKNFFFVIPPIRTLCLFNLFQSRKFLKNPALVWWLAETNSVNTTNSNNFQRKKTFVCMCLGFRVLKFRVMCLRNMKFHILTGVRLSLNRCVQFIWIFQNLFEFPKNRQPSITILKIIS
jgi:hypothetical protein